jgi:hypothetical protein
LNNININLEEFDIFNIDIERANNLMCHPFSLYLYDHINLNSALNILRAYGKPKSVTIIDIKIVPSEKTIKHYSFSGICNIIDSLFEKSFTEYQIDDFCRNPIFIKVFYQKDDLYNIPKLCIDFIIWGNLKDETLECLSNVLKNDEFQTTGFNSQIDDKETFTAYELLNILRPELIVGQESFADLQCLKNFNIDPAQLMEMDCIHAMKVFTIDKEDIINWKSHSIYKQLQNDFSPDDNNSESTDDAIEELMNRILSNN